MRRWTSWRSAIRAKVSWLSSNSVRNTGGIQRHDRRGVFETLDLAGDVAGVELLDLVGQDTTLEGDAAPSEADLALATGALGLADRGTQVVKGVKTFMARSFS